MEIQNAESSFQFFCSLLNFRGEWMVASPRSMSRALRAATKYVGFFADFVRSSFLQIECRPKTQDEKLMQRNFSWLKIQQGIVSEILDKSQENFEPQRLWSVFGGRNSSARDTVSMQRQSDENRASEFDTKQGNQFVDSVLQSLYGCLQAALMFLCTLAEALEADKTVLTSKEWPRRDDLLMAQQECVIVTQDWNDQEGVLMNNQIRLLAQKMMQVLKCSRWLYKTAGHQISETFQQEVITCVGFLERLAA
eukprot:TRINITY_DN1369_c0_g1_i1.p1 TRINITY_DN1369_c0_g1~~TRINITY_DN1369_c0_g1_i1.p1  ORF type:complete len:251 (-),score=35.89 TRINITY_DN1369_c0_g1_i1:213-965(-)